MPPSVPPADAGRTTAPAGAAGTTAPPGAAGRTAPADAARPASPAAAGRTTASGDGLRRMTPAEALRVAAGLGPYFTWEPWTAEGGWRPFTSPDEEIIEAARRSLGGVESRVAASITFLGAASRIVSPPLGALILTGVLPSARLWWRPSGASWQLGYDRAEPGADLVTAVLDGLVGPMLAAFRDRYSVSPKVLWGNVASAVAGAAGLLADLRPEHAARAAEVTAGLLGRAPLAGTGTLIRPDPTSARVYLIRRSCCLYYRVPGGGLCGDCVLAERPGRPAAP